MKKIILGSIVCANLLFANSVDAEKLLNTLMVGQNFKCFKNICTDKNINKKVEEGFLKIGEVKINFIDFNFEFSENEMKSVDKVLKNCTTKIKDDLICSKENINKSSKIVFTKLLNKVKGVKLYNYQETDFNKKEISSIGKVSLTISESVILLQNKKMQEIKKEDLNLSVKINLENISIKQSKEDILNKFKKILFKENIQKINNQGKAISLKRNEIKELNNNVIKMYGHILNSVLKLDKKKDFEIKLNTEITNNEMLLKLSVNSVDKNLFNINTNTIFKIKNIDTALSMISQSDLTSQQGGMMILMSLASNTFFESISIQSNVQEIKNISNKIVSEEFKKDKLVYLNSIKENQKELSEIELFIYKLLSLNYSEGEFNINNNKKLPITSLLMLLQQKNISEVLEIKSNLK